MVDNLPYQPFVFQSNVSSNRSSSVALSYPYPSGSASSDPPAASAPDGTSDACRNFPASRRKASRRKVAVGRILPALLSRLSIRAGPDRLLYLPSRTHHDLTIGDLSALSQTVLD